MPHAKSRLIVAVLAGLGVTAACVAVAAAQVTITEYPAGIGAWAGP